MTVKLKPVRGQVIVITGASSGIGLTTARMAVKRGARVVLVARNAGALRELEAELNRDEHRAAHVVADMGYEGAAHRIAQTALEQFGRFDTWVNGAGVGIYGRLLDVTTEDSRRLFETNFWGVVYGSLEAASYLRQHGGAIINLGSEVSDRSLPILGMYAASKFAVRAFTDALRMELEMDSTPVSVTLVKPSATDTPFPNHAKSYLDQEPALPEPIYAPEIVAEVILHCAEHPERDMYGGGAAKVHALEEKFMPRLTDRFMEKSLLPKMKSGQPANPADDALHHPTTGLHQRGKSPGKRRESSLFVKASMHPTLTALLIGGGALAAMSAATAAIANRR